MVGRIIETEACVAEGAAWLAQQEPVFERALALTGPLALRRRPPQARSLPRFWPDRRGFSGRRGLPDSLGHVGYLAGRHRSAALEG